LQFACAAEIQEAELLSHEIRQMFSGLATYLGKAKPGMPTVR
jgi:hypothetical protein